MPPGLPSTVQALMVVPGVVPGIWMSCTALAGKVPSLVNVLLVSRILCPPSSEVASPALTELSVRAIAATASESAVRSGAAGMLRFIMCLSLKEPGCRVGYSG